MDFSTSFKYLLFRLYRKYSIKKHELNYLFWECTLRCNLNCLHCGSDCLKQSEIEDMPAEDFIKVLDDIKENNRAEHLTVCITGGEPLLRNDLEDVGREIIKRGFYWGIVTNGMLITPERFVSLINAGMTSMSYSLDGFEKEHSYLRQNPQSYKKVCEGIKLAVDFQKKYGNRLIFDVITCVHKKNLEILPALREDLINRGVKMWRIFSIFPEGRAGQNDLFLTKEEYKRLMDFIVETRSYKDSQDRSIHLNYACEGYLGDYELKVRDYFFFCRGGINVGSVMCDGSIGACLSVRGKDFIQGNIYGQARGNSSDTYSSTTSTNTSRTVKKEVSVSFMDIWENKFQNLRKRSWAKHGKCRKCKVWNKCMGNGLHLHHDMSCEVAHCNYELLT
ncbi:MAG: radical SAM protein [Treponemataceae bacterium]|nr:radical SAM protein [Treponemataceae bacterium]